jgi:hypothetical protein
MSFGHCSSRNVGRGGVTHSIPGRLRHNFGKLAIQDTASRLNSRR